jgi:hypothetical protein
MAEQHADDVADECPTCGCPYRCAEGQNASLRAELRRLYGQFRLALSNGEKLLNDGGDGA